ncbi:MAG: hypothetical protein OXC63_15135 [Aestuariivita sp.]|nr:hypothetical protein [Aestuariivita sp.]
MADALLASDLLTSGYFLPPQNDAHFFETARSVWSRKSVGWSDKKDWLEDHPIFLCIWHRHRQSKGYELRHDGHEHHTPPAIALSIVNTLS